MTLPDDEILGLISLDNPVYLPICRVLSQRDVLNSYHSEKRTTDRTISELMKDVLI